MHYYSFNIGDYAKETQHLDEMEDLAYRRMLDVYYNCEKPLPEDVSKIARLIRMRTHSESIANVLSDFFILGDDGYHNRRIDKELEAYQAKSDKARKSAEARWNKPKKESEGNADLMRMHSEVNANASDVECEGNANHKPLNIKQEPLTNKQIKIPYQRIVDAYREVLPELPEMKLLTDKRKRMIKRLFNEDPKHKHIEWWEDYFRYIRGSDHLMNRIERAPPHQNWSCDLPWLVDINNFAKIIDGKYHK